MASRRSCAPAERELTGAPASCRQDMARLAGHRQLETHAQVHKRLARPSRGRGGLVLHSAAAVGEVRILLSAFKTIRSAELPMR